MSVPMTLKDGTFVVRFFRQISITLAPAVWVIMTKFGRIAHWIYTGSATPIIQRGRAPALPNFGVRLYLCIHLLT